MADTQNSAPPAPQPQPGYTIRKRHRDWMVIDPQGQLVCLTVYKRGAARWRWCGGWRRDKNSSRGRGFPRLLTFIPQTAPVARQPGE